MQKYKKEQAKSKINRQIGKQNRRERQTQNQAKGCLQESEINRRTGNSALNIDQRSDRDVL